MMAITGEEGLDTSLIEFFDSLRYFVSDKFTEKWKYKYGEILLTTFIDIIINALKKSRPVKYSSLLNKLRRKTGLDDNVIEEFLNEVDAKNELYPIILP